MVLIENTIINRGDLVVTYEGFLVELHLQITYGPKVSGDIV